MIQTAPALSALVLAGGRARRLGGEKAGRLVGDRTLLQRALALAEAVSDDVLLLPGERQIGHAGVCVPDAPGCPGPVGALLAGLDAARHSWALLLPCDQPFADADLVRLLAQTAARTAAQVVLPLDEFGPQPFHGLWRTDLADTARAYARGGGRSLMGLLDLVTVVPIAAPSTRALFDVDTESDLALARSLCAP